MNVLFVQWGVRFQITNLGNGSLSLSAWDLEGNHYRCKRTLQEYPLEFLTERFVKTFSCDSLDPIWEKGDRPRKRKAIVVVFEEVDGELSVSFSDNEGGNNVSSGADGLLVMMEMLRGRPFWTNP